MRKFFVLLMVFVLAACGTPAAPADQPVAAPPEPTQTPVVIVQTVVVEPTQAPVEQPTQAPAEPVVVTVVVEPTQAPAVAAPTEAPATDGSAPIALDNVLGAGVFINMTMSGNAFTYRCFPRDITFSITANDPAIRSALLYYRMVDRPDALYPSEWKNGGEMTDNGGGNFSIVFSGENVDSSLRLDEAWFDFQFIGLNKGGGVIDRSQKIERLVTFTKDCP